MEALPRNAAWESESKIILAKKRHQSIKERVRGRPGARVQFGGVLVTTQFQVPPSLREQGVVSMRIRQEYHDDGRVTHSWTIKLKNGDDTAQVKHRDETLKGKGRSAADARVSLMRAAQTLGWSGALLVEYTSRKRRDSYVVPVANNGHVITYDFDVIQEVNARKIAPLYFLEVEWPNANPDMRLIASLDIQPHELTGKSTKRVLRERGILPQA